MYLSFKYVSNAGAKAIAQAIEVNKTLAKLRLRISDISSVGDISIAEAMDASEMLSYWDFSSKNC